MRDILLVSLGATAGLRAADDELAASLERAGASVAQVRARRPRDVRTLALTDLGWAVAARRAAVAGIAAHEPRTIVYSTTTAALLWPRPGALRFDALAAATRPGRHGAWQRPVERRRLAQATVLVPQAAGGLEGVEAPSEPVVVPVPVAASGPGVERRDLAAITYGANWGKKGLDRVLAAWDLTRAEGGRLEATHGIEGPAEATGRDGAREPDEWVRGVVGDDEELVVAGVAEEQVRAAWAAARHLVPRAGHTLPTGVRVVGPLEPAAYRALLRRARVFVTAPRREDYGIAQLEALADGCLLVTTAAPGPYAALPLARALHSGLVVEDGGDVAALATALRTALTGGATAPCGGSCSSRWHDPPDGSSAEASAAALLAPFSRAAADRVVAEELLPRLLGTSPSATA